MPASSRLESPPDNVEPLRNSTVPFDSICPATEGLLPGMRFTTERPVGWTKRTVSPGATLKLRHWMMALAEGVTVSVFPVVLNVAVP